MPRWGQNQASVEIYRTCNRSASRCSSPSGWRVQFQNTSLRPTWHKNNGSSKRGKRLQKQAGANLSPEVAAQQQRSEAFYRQWFGKFETALHQDKSGPHWLGKELVAKLVTKGLHHRDGRVYELEAYCVMPNHVHTVFTPYVPKVWVFQDRWRWEPEDDAVLSTVMQSLKGYTAYQCNRVLGRRGQFWEHESYDRYVRDYVLNNPVKAGLVAKRNDWPWSYRWHPEDVTATCLGCGSFRARSDGKSSEPPAPAPAT